MDRHDVRLPCLRIHAAHGMATARGTEALSERAPDERQHHRGCATRIGALRLPLHGRARARVQLLVRWQKSRDTMGIAGCFIKRAPALARLRNQPVTKENR